MGFLELRSYAAGILDNSPAIQGARMSIYILNINVFCSVRKSQQELVSMNCSVSVGIAVSVPAWMSLLLLRQQLKLAPSDRRWIDAATLHFECKLLKRGLLFPRSC